MLVVDCPAAVGFVQVELVFSLLHHLVTLGELEWNEMSMLSFLSMLLFGCTFESCDVHCIVMEAFLFNLVV